MNIDFQCMQASDYDAFVQSDAVPEVELELFDTSPAVWGALRAYCPELFSDQPGGDSINVFAAGGFIRDTILGRQPKDLDIFVDTGAKMRVVESCLREGGWEMVNSSQGVVRTWRKLLLSMHTESVRHVQIIRDGHASPHEILGRFDLTCCCCAIDVNNGDCYASLAFFEALDSRKLILNNPAHPAHTLQRVAKLMRCGFTIDADELMKIYTRIKHLLNTHGVPVVDFDRLVA